MGRRKSSGSGSKFINSTKTVPDGTSEKNSEFIEEFKKVNVTPESGFNQHLNSLGPTCFFALDSKGNSCNLRTALVAMEVLAQRAIQDGQEHSLAGDSSPEEAETFLRSIGEFARTRLKALKEQRSQAVQDAAVAAAEKAGIKLNLKPVKV